MSDQISTEVVKEATNNTIPDTVLQEIEKVGKLEKSLSLLNQRQTNVEKSIDILKDSSKKQEEGDDKDEENVIDEEEEKEKPKKSKNKTTKDKLKAQLNTVEKKRYENIGIEFAKGTETVFKEIKKAEELKQKMSTKKVEEIQQSISDEDDDGGDGGKKKISFLKLSLAIVAVSGILYLFRNKIEELIPGFKDGMESAATPFKKIGNALFGKLFDNLSIGLTTAFDNLFNGEDGIKQSFNIFFLNILPEVIYQSGLALFEAFGGSVSTSVKEYGDYSIKATDEALKSGQNYAKEEDSENAEIEKLLKLESQYNNASRSSKFATEEEIKTASKFSGRDALYESGLLDSVSTLMNVSKDAIANYSSYGDSFMTYINEQMKGVTSAEDIGNKLDNIAEDFYVRYINSDIESDKGKTNYQNWLNNQWNPMMRNNNNIGKIQKAIEIYKGHQQQIAKSQADKKKYEEEVKKFAEGYLEEEKELGEVSVGVTVEKMVQDVGKKITENVVQDKFMNEVNTLCETIKNAFNFDESNSNLLTELSNTAINFIKQIISNLVSPLVDFIKKLIRLLPKNSLTGGTTGKSTLPTQPNSIGNYSSFTNTGIGASRDVNAPVILLDFDLNGMALDKFNSVFKHENDLVQLMQKTNAKLEKIKSLGLNKGQNTNPQNSSETENNNEEEIKNLNVELVKTVGKVGNIEERVESIENALTDSNNFRNGMFGRVEFVNQSRIPY